MRCVIQRVTKASVKVEHEIVGEIQLGLLVLLGISVEDTLEDINWLANKIVGLRIFSDDDGKMNLDIRQVNGDILLISQFTLHASTKKGNRPSFIHAAPGDMANEMYQQFGDSLKEKEIHVEYGIFGSDMKVELLNDGPVTIIIDSKSRE